MITSIHPLAPSSNGEQTFTQVMEGRYGFPRGTARATLEGDDQIVLGGFDAEDRLRAFIVFVRYAKLIAHSEYAPMMRELQMLLSRPDVHAWGFEAIWFDRDHDGVVESLVPIVRHAEARLCSTPGYSTLVQFGLSGPDHDAFRSALVDEGFKRTAREYIHFAMTLPEVESSPERSAFPRLEGLRVVTFAEAEPDLSQLAECYNGIFAQPGLGITPSDLTQQMAHPMFSRPLSLLFLDTSDRTVGFVLASETGRGRMELRLFGFLPSHRGKGVGFRCIPAYVSRCNERGVKEMRFAVSSANDRTLHFMKYGFASRELYRRIILLKVRKDGVSSQ